MTKTTQQRADALLATAVSKSDKIPEAKKAAVIQQLVLNELDRQFVKALNGKPTLGFNR